MSCIDYVASALDVLNITIEVFFFFGKIWIGEPKYSCASLSTTNSTWTGLQTNTGLVLIIGYSRHVVGPCHHGNGMEEIA